MVKQTRKYIETGMRKAAEEAGNKGRSMTYETIGRATRLSGDIVSIFLELIDKRRRFSHIARTRSTGVSQTKSRNSIGAN